MVINQTTRTASEPQQPPVYLNQQHLNQQQQQQQNLNLNHHHHHHTYPHSISSSSTTNLSASSQFPLPSTILTRADLRESVDTFDAMLSAAKNYRSSLMALSTATSSFAKCLEDCARLKGARSDQSFNINPTRNNNSDYQSDLLNDRHQFHSNSFGQASDQSNNKIPASSKASNFDAIDDQSENQSNLTSAQRLMAASGLHFMTANLEQVLSATFYKSFEIPLLDLYDSYRCQLADRQTSYESEVSIKTKAIRETELRNLCQGIGKRSRKSTGRDLDSFRKGLQELQLQVESVEKLKQSYYAEVASGEMDLWRTVADNVSLVVKSEVEVYDRIASKATSDPTLESMVTSIPDPFDAYKNPSGNTSTSQQPEIYSILPPLTSILTSAPSVKRQSVDHLDSTLLNPSTPQQIPIPPSPSVSMIPDYPHLNSASHWVNYPTSTPQSTFCAPVAGFEIEQDLTGRYSQPQNNRTNSLFDSPPQSNSGSNQSSRSPSRVRLPSLPNISLGGVSASSSAESAQAINYHTPTPLRNVTSIESCSDGSLATIQVSKLKKSSSSPTLDSVPESGQNNDGRQADGSENLTRGEGLSSSEAEFMKSDGADGIGSESGGDSDDLRRNQSREEILKGLGSDEGQDISKDEIESMIFKGESSRSFDRVDSRNDDEFLRVEEGDEQRRSSIGGNSLMKNLGVLNETEHDEEGDNLMGQGPPSGIDSDSEDASS
ncbi:hypothetical protein BY996DRAFT_6897698 [Phakopsora pachyrhizi]|uniref:Expressed protein n=1 Tax=Phakopsora pachyrhizi TaxID=170000 RepID=A0AAV0ASB5_PHAPC|nr:hypothetical protein BY996DRAFT_6897698 [Phakopsora pachyrhizi]CAH7670732.1 expressed protein [Phakopsora pachyrhizi]